MAAYEASRPDFVIMDIGIKDSIESHMWTMQPRSTDAKDASLKRRPKGSGFLPAKRRFFTRGKARSAKRLKWVVIAASVVVTLSGLWSQISAAQAETRPLAFLYAKDFNSSLVAVTGQIVVFEPPAQDVCWGVLALDRMGLGIWTVHLPREGSLRRFRRLLHPM